jgi:glycosyltransferase involved in cell wall biosynthesis
MVGAWRRDTYYLQKNYMKVAILHDFLFQYGGAERVLEVFSEMFPDAVIYTLYFDETAFPSFWKNKNIKSLVPNLPGLRNYPQFYASLLVSKMRSISLSEFDLVISSDMIFSKMVVCPPQVAHICYQYSPADMLYHFLPRRNSRNWIHFIATGLQKSFLRREDYLAAQVPDRFITLSYYVNKRIAKYYRRVADVIYPPVSLLEKDSIIPVPGDYYLLVSRLVPNKYVELAITCCTRNKLPLVVLGSGSELARLRSIAGDTVRFITNADDTVRNQTYRGCKALLVCNEEDFGITPIEAMSFGRGVIAYGKGGVLETIEEGKTGTFFNELTVDSLYSAIQRYDLLRIDPLYCRLRSEQFSKDIFISKIGAVIDELCLQRVV